MSRVGFVRICSTHAFGRCFSFFSAIILALSVWCFPTAAKDTMPLPPTDERMGSVLLCNLENNQLLYAKDADKKVYPSGSVKIMTGLIACRTLSEKLDEQVTVTAAMIAGVTGRQMPLAVGECISVRDLLYAAICGGYNDAAMVLACLSSGSVAAFVNDMNAEAERLGTTATYYTNPTGIHDPAMSISAHDLSLIAREAYADELYMEISSARTHTVPPTNLSPERLFSNRNLLISDSSGNYFNGDCRGMNVGMTDEGGWSLVTVSERGGAHDLCIILGGEDTSDELIPVYLYANQLMSWGHKAYSYRTVMESGKSLGTHPVAMTGISSSEAELVAKDELRIYLPVDADMSELAVSVEMTGGQLTAPLTEGQVVGSAMVFYQDHVVGRVDLIVTEDFTRSGFLNGMAAFRAYLCSRAFWIGVVIFVVLLILFLRMTGTRGGRYGIRSTRRKSKVRYTKRRY